MAAIRLFVAILPPAFVRTELAALACPFAGVRWTPEENIHLTLRFIGETETEKLECFAESLTRVKVEPFLLPVGGVGLFPSRGSAKVLWAGVGHAHPRLFQLRKQVDEALLTVDSGVEMRSFHPHFTLGRLGETYETKELGKFLARNEAFEAPPFFVNEFHLMETERHLGSTPSYRPVQTYPLSPR